MSTSTEFETTQQLPFWENVDQAKINTIHDLHEALSSKILTHTSFSTAIRAFRARESLFQKAGIAVREKPLLKDSEGNLVVVHVTENPEAVLDLYSADSLDGKPDKKICDWGDRCFGTGIHGFLTKEDTEAHLRKHPSATPVGFRINTDQYRSIQSTTLPVINKQAFFRECFLFGRRIIEAHTEDIELVDEVIVKTEQDIIERKSLESAAFDITSNVLDVISGLTGKSRLDLRLVIQEQYLGGINFGKSCPVDRRFTDRAELEKVVDFYLSRIPELQSAMEKAQLDIQSLLDVGFNTDLLEAGLYGDFIHIDTHGKVRITNRQGLIQFLLLLGPSRLVLPLTEELKHTDLQVGLNALAAKYNGFYPIPDVSRRLTDDFALGTDAAFNTVGVIRHPGQTISILSKTDTLRLLQN